MVGNGITNWKYDGNPSAFEMSYWHSLIDKGLYDSKTANNCSLNENSDNDDQSDVCENISE